MKEFEANKHTIDYCVYSGSKPDDFVLTTAHKQQLHDWFPYRKRTTIYIPGRSAPLWNGRRLGLCAAELTIAIG